MDDYLGFIEFFVVVLFVMAWGVLELQGRRLDRKKEAERAKQQNFKLDEKQDDVFSVPAIPK